MTRALAAVLLAATTLAGCVTVPQPLATLPQDCANVPSDLLGRSYAEIHTAWGEPDETNGSGFTFDHYRLASGETLVLRFAAEVNMVECLPPSAAPRS